jgi:hypothetical protein
LTPARSPAGTCAAICSATARSHFAQLPQRLTEQDAAVPARCSPRLPITHATRAVHLAAPTLNPPAHQPFTAATDRCLPEQGRCHVGLASSGPRSTRAQQPNRSPPPRSGDPDGPTSSCITGATRQRARPPAVCADAVTARPRTVEDHAGHMPRCCNLTQPTHQLPTDPPKDAHSLAPTGDHKPAPAHTPPHDDSILLY